IAPTVGDEVEVVFDVGFAVYSVLGLRLRGAGPLLEGETVLFGSRNPVFNLTAVAPGTAVLRLAVTHATEEQCTYGDGPPYFREGPDHTVVSGSSTLTITDSGSGCAGDCDGSGQVSIAELVEAVNIALGDESVQRCATLDRNRDGSVSVSE